MAPIESYGRRVGTFGTVIFTTLIGVVVNLAVYSIGTLAGGTFDFTDNGESFHVDALTITLFTAIPLIVGLTLIAIVSRWWKWAVPVALVIAPIIAIATIFTMTTPADFDRTSTITLAAAHVVVGIAVVGGLLALRSPAPKSAFRFA